MGCLHLFYVASGQTETAGTDPLHLAETQCPNLRNSSRNSPAAALI
jgi:hypothetical protein